MRLFSDQKISIANFPEKMAIYVQKKRSFSKNSSILVNTGLPNLTYVVCGQAHTLNSKCSW